MCKPAIISFPRSGRALTKRLIKAVSKVDLNELDIHMDHSLEVDKLKVKPVVCLIRHPIYSIVSLWEYSRKEQAYKDGNLGPFHRFVRKKINLWFEFYDKSRELPFKLHIQYQNLVFNAYNTISRICKALSLEMIDDYYNKVDKIMDLQSHNITERYKPRNLQDCPFYNRKDFAKYWNRVNRGFRDRQIIIMGI